VLKVPLNLTNQPANCTVMVGDRYFSAGESGRGLFWATCT